MVKLEIEGNVNIKIKSQFIRELWEDTFSKNKNDDAHEHVERNLDIISLFNIPRVTHDVVMLCDFLITLTGAAKRWVDRLSLGTIDSWDLLKKAFIQRNVDTNSNFEGINAIVSKLDSLSQDMKKLKEYVHAIQVGCQTCGGPHLDKKCPLHEEVKSIKEVNYGKFGRSSPFNNGAKYRVGLPRYYIRVGNRPPFKEKRPSLEELLNKHLDQSIRKKAEMEEWVKKLQDNIEINTRNHCSSLKNLETQIDHLTKEFYAKIASEVPNSSAAQCNAVHANDEAPIDNTSSNETNKVSFISNDNAQAAQEEDDVPTKSCHANYHQKS
uniref:Retrotransposon gag domain-containing protein n=1 Tax=Tanacetum cinerariifolium TaxID=118510 RepID=A0A6L2KRY7_TANCI|nr:hypothetical protein [Tanacetum cinerariifolium]